jgi:hypothetical protein
MGLESREKIDFDPARMSTYIISAAVCAAVKAPGRPLIGQPMAAARVRFAAGVGVCDAAAAAAADDDLLPRVAAPSGAVSFFGLATTCCCAVTTLLCSSTQHTRTCTHKTIQNRNYQNES